MKEQEWPTWLYILSAIGLVDMAVQAISSGEVKIIRTVLSAIFEIFA